MDPRFSSFVAQLRELNPDRAGWSDDALMYSALRDARQQNALDQYPDLVEYEKQAEKDSRGVTGELKQAFGSGVDNFQAKLYDTAALAGDVTGIDRLKNWGEQGREDNEKESSAYRPIVGELEKVKSASDFAYWLANIVGSNAPQMAGTMAAAGVATALAPEAAVGAGATGLAGLGVRIGSALGMGAGETAAAGLSAKALSGFMAASAMGFTQMQNYGELKELGGENVIPISIANGLIGSALEAYGPASAMARLTKSVGKEAATAATHSVLDLVPAPVMNVALGLAKEGSKEMLTEIAQEAVTIGSEIVSNRNNPKYAISDDQVVSRLMNNGAAGFILGGLHGAVFEHAHGKMSNTEGAANTPQAQEAQAAATPASLDVPIPPVRTTAETPSPAATPAPAPAATTPPATATTERVLASPEAQRILRELGMSAEEAATMTEDEAHAAIFRAQEQADAARAQQETARATAAAQAQAAQQQAAEAQAVAERRAAQQSAADAQAAAAAQDAEYKRLQAEAQAELRDAQAMPPQPPKPSSNVVRMKRSDFREGGVQGDTVKAPVTQQEIRDQANLFRIGNDAEFFDFNSGAKMNVPTLAVVEPIKPVENPAAATPPPTAAPAPAAATPPATAPVTAPTTAPAATVKMPSLIGAFRAAEGRAIGLQDTVKLARADGDPLRSTRNAAIIRKNDGKLLLVPVFKDKDGQVKVLERGATLTQGELVPLILERVQREVGGTENLGERGLKNALNKESTKPSTRARDAQIKRIAEEMGWSRRTQETKLSNSTPLSSLIQDEKTNAIGEITDVYHFDGTIPAGIREVTAEELMNLDRSHFDEKIFADSNRTQPDVPLDSLVKQDSKLHQDNKNSEGVVDPTEGPSDPQADAGAASSEQSPSPIEVIEPGSPAAVAKPVDTISKDESMAALKEVGIDGEAVKKMARAVGAKRVDELRKNPGLIGVTFRDEFRKQIKEVATPEGADAFLKLASKDQKAVMQAAVRMMSDAIGLEPLVAAPTATTETVPPAVADTIKPKNASPASEPSAPAKKTRTFASTGFKDEVGSTPPTLESVGLGQAALYEMANLVGESNARLLSKWDVTKQDRQITAKFRDKFRALLSKVGTTEGALAFQTANADTQLAIMKTAIAQMAEILQVEYVNDAADYRKQPVDYRPTSDHVESVFNNVLRTAARLGIDVSIFQTNEADAHDFFRQEGGAYIPSKRAILLVMDNTLRPTYQNTLTALHELLHGVIKTEPLWVQKAVHSMIEQLAAGKLAYTNNPNADVRLQNGTQTSAHEKLVEHLTLWGMERQPAETLVARLWRAVVHTFTRAAMWAQKSVLGEDATGGFMARKYAENRVKSILAGDFTGRSFMDGINPIPSMGQIRRAVFSGDTWHFTQGYPFSNDGTSAAARYNIMAPVAEAREQLQLDGTVSLVDDLKELHELLGQPDSEFRNQPKSLIEARLAEDREKTLSRTRIEVAVHNQLIKFDRQAYEQAKATYPELPREQILANRRAGIASPDNITFEGFLKAHRFQNSETIKDDAIATLKAQLEKEFKTDPASVPFDDTITIDQLPNNERGAANEKLAQIVGTRLAHASENLKAKRDEVASRLSRFQQNANDIRDIDREISSYESTDKQARQFIRDALSQLKRDLKRSDKAAVAFGSVESTLRALAEDPALGDVDTKLTSRVLDGIMVDPLPLASIFKQLFKLETDGVIDLGASSPAEIRAAIMDEVTLRPDSSLAHLIELGEGPDAVPRGTALMTAIVSFAKDRAHLIDTIRLQLSESESSKADLQRIRDVLRETNIKALDEIRSAALKDMKRPGNRAIFNWLKRRDEAIRENALISRLQRETEYLRPSVLALRETMSRIDQRLGIGHELNIVPGAMIPVPPKADASADEVRTNLVEITLSREKWLKSEEVNKILRAQYEWLQHWKDKPDMQGDMYTTISRHYERLKVLAGSDRIFESLGKFNSGKNASVAEEMRRTNTRTGQEAARRVHLYDEVQRAHSVLLTEAGKAWEVAAAKFFHLAGVNAENAQIMYYDPALFFLGNRPDLTETEAFLRLREQYALSPQTEAMARNDATWGAFEDWMRSTKKIIRSIRDIMRERGMAVTDESLMRDNPTVKRDANGKPIQTAAQRDAIDRGVSDYTAPRRFHNDVVKAVQMFNDLLKARGDSMNPFADSEFNAGLRPEELGKILNEMLNNDPAFKAEFLEPLLTDTAWSHPPAPEREDGRKLHVPVDVAKIAWDASKGDVMEYAKYVMQIMGGPNDSEALAKYQGDLINYIGRTFRKLDTVVNPKQGASVGIKGLAHYAMDARTLTDVPRAWLTHQQFSVEDNRQALHTIAANVAYGADFREIDKLVDEMHREMAELARELPRNSADRAAMAKEKGKDWLKLREDAEEKLRRVNTFKQILRDIYEPRGGAVEEHSVLLELLSGAVSGMVMGPMGAIKNLLSLIDPMALERSLSVSSLQTVARGNAAFGRNLLAGIVGVFGPDLLKNHRYTRLQEQAGGFDVASKVAFADWLKGTRGINNNFDRTAFGKVQRVARMARNAMTNAKLGLSGGNTGPVLRTINQFAYTQIACNYAITEALLKRYEEFALRGAEFYRNHPDKIGQLLTAKDIGYADARGFEGLRNQAMDHGFTVEELAEKALRRKDAGAEIFDIPTVRKVMNMTLTGVSGESSAASRPAYMLTSKFGRINGMLVGWNFFKTAQVLQLMRSPNGRRDLSSLARGAFVLSLGMVPLAIAFSKLLDEYEEKVVGKRSNRLPLGGDNLFNALLERSVAMGSFGLLGNVMDTAMNYTKDGGGRFALSVDQSIVWLNSAEQMVKILGAMNQMGWDNANYANVIRPLGQAFGAGGALQYIQIMNRLFPETLRGVPLFEQEAGINARINAGNILRAVGRDMGMEIRAQGGSGSPNAVTPYITNMALATFRDDPEAFQQAYHDAVMAAREEGKPDPFDYVKRAYQTRNPLKAVYRVTPTTQEVGQLLMRMDDYERQSVMDAVKLFNRYGGRLGIEPYYGSDGSSTAAMARAVQRKRMSVDSMRSVLASRRTESDDTGVDR